MRYALAYSDLIAPEPDHPRADAIEAEACAIYDDEDRLQGVFEEHYVGVEHDDLVAELRELHMLLRDNYRRLHGQSEAPRDKAAYERAWNDLKQRAANSVSFVEGLVTDEAEYVINQVER